MHISRCHIFCSILQKKKFCATRIVEIIKNHIVTFPFVIVSTSNTDKRNGRSLKQWRHNGRSNYLFIEWVEENSRLDSFSQTHLICKDCVSALSPGESQPIQTFKLVGMECAPCAVQVLWLTIKLYSGLKNREKLEDNISHRSMSFKTFSLAILHISTSL